MSPYPLGVLAQVLLAALSFLLVAFGQPAWSPLAGLVAAACGYALIWRVVIAHPSRKGRFWIGTAWYCAVQLFQLYWFTSHPYAYIYSVYLFLGITTGIEFGILSRFITPELFSSKKLLPGMVRLLPLPALWVLFEWSRLFALSGFSWNPVGMALTGALYPLQMASFWGLFGLSFWVVYVNLLALRAWLHLPRTLTSTIAWGAMAAVPYIYGAAQLTLHSPSDEKEKHFSALLVQTAIPAEEASGSVQGDLIGHVLAEWKKILEIIKQHRGKAIDLIVLPEFVVPFGTYSYVYPLSSVLQTFDEVYGRESHRFLPSLNYPFVTFQHTPKGGGQLLVNNAFWVQSIANLFDADTLAGLEDVEDTQEGEREYYSAAIITRPHGEDNPTGFAAERYAKRVLVPMGEYIPFSFCKKMAEKYGVFGSFTCGKEATVMRCRGHVLSPSICYEETFGHLISEGRRNGADLLVNITSDVWYPNSMLPRQHFDHARVRTVENGVPLLRACNTGITGAIDSCGRIVSVLGGDTPEEFEWVADALFVEVPTSHYFTPYSLWGDWFVVGISVVILFAVLLNYYLNPRLHI